MEVYINQLKRVIDRIIMPEFPDLETYKFEVREKNNYTYVAVVYIPERIKMYNDWKNEEEDKWKDIVAQTRRYYDATGHDEHYLLGAIGELRRAVGVAEPGTPPPIRWWWKLNNEQDWRTKRDKNTEFYNLKRWENDANQNT
jgi:hypothetical protein